MGHLDLTKESYTENPDAYWEARGGPGYPGTLRPEYREQVPIQKEFFLALMKGRNVQSLLDFGCGTGKHFDVWQPIGRVVAYDRSQSMIDVSRETQQRLGTGYNIIRGNSNNRKSLPFASGQFDIVAACEVLPHVLEADIQFVVQELHRILGDGGAIGAIVSPPDHQFAAHSFNHDYKDLFTRCDFFVSYDRISNGYRYLVAEKRGPLGTVEGAGSARRDSTVTENKTVGTSC